MCGICGYVRRRQVTPDQLKRMNDTMYHRGPDDSGEESYALSGGYRMGLAQRRLSILDLSSMGHQPMHSANDRVIVVYNGEIYNLTESSRSRFSTGRRRNSIWFVTGLERNRSITGTKTGSSCLRRS